MKKFFALIGFVALSSAAFAAPVVQSCTDTECTVTETVSWKVDLAQKKEERESIKAQIAELQARLAAIRAEITAYRAKGGKIDVATLDD